MAIDKAGAKIHPGPASGILPAPDVDLAELEKLRADLEAYVRAEEARLQRDLRLARSLNTSFLPGATPPPARASDYALARFTDYVRLT